MQYEPTIRKVDAASVPYGENICRRGRSVWAAYSGNKLVAVGATKAEARAHYRGHYFKWASEQTHAPK